MNSAIASEFPPFDEYFAAVDNGRLPYGWQRELAEHVRVDGWPATIEVPTGLGKTTTIAIAVYELARELHERAHSPAEEIKRAPRRAPQRIFHLVNRRVLVDDTHSYIHQFAHAINTAVPGSPLRPVRDALATLLPASAATVEPVIVSAAIHGGTVRQNTWLRARGCTIVSLTPHQFVSRLVMRGFGVTPAARPIHAGLVGIDRLVLLDEPHLSAPAYTTIRDAERLQSRSTADLGIPRGATVLLGATVPAALRDEADTDRRFTIDTTAEDIRARFHAPRLLTCATTRSTQDRAFVDVLSEEALAAYKSGAPSVAVFVNTIDVAQCVYERVRETLGSRAKLVTSRFRPLDRGALPDTPEGITVTTQCLEVGVDVSFDALVTEAASWDAFVQRLGRLNREGTANQARAVLVTTKNGAVRKGTAAVYRQEPVRAFLNVLEERLRETGGELDVSSAALQQIHAEHADILAAPLPRSGTLHRGLVPLMTITRPVPLPDLPVDALVSGPDEPRQREVRVAWRATPSALEASGAAAVADGEYLSLPSQVFTAFLTTGTSARAVLTDLDHTAEVADGNQTEAPLWHDDQVWVWHLRDERWRQVKERSDLDVGDSFVLASALGGYQEDLGWTGRRAESNESGVSDQALAVALAARIDEIRATGQVSATHAEWIITPSTLESARDQIHGLTEEQRLELDGYVSELRTVWPEHDTADELSDEELSSLEAALNHTAGKLVEFVHRLAGIPHRPPVVNTATDTLLAGRVSVRWPVPAQGERAPAGEGLISLASHLAQVGEWAEADARAAGLSRDVVTALRRAGLVHDLGKSDARFQKILAGSSDAEVSDTVVRIPLPQDISEHDGAETATREPEWRELPLLAKSIATIPGSSRFATSHAAERRLRILSGLSDRWRHEVASAQWARSAGEAPLVTHLVGSHHGWYRPGVPPVDGDQLEGFSHAAEFLALNATYGPWGLAYLEAALRLADWRASSLPEQPGQEAETEAAALLRRWQDSNAQQGSFGSGLGIALSGEDSPVAAGESDGRGGVSYELTGLVSHPTTGWYAAVGLLAAAAGRGDLEATLHWRSLMGKPGDPPTLPVLTVRDSLDVLVTEVYESPVWEQTTKLVIALTSTSDGLRVKNQKLTFPGSLRPLLTSAETAGADFLLGLVGDLAEAEKRESDEPKLALCISAYANNASYPGVALDSIAKGTADGGSVTLAALTDVQCGYTDKQCDGGFDRGRSANYRVTGIGSADGKEAVRVSRTALAPLVIFGMAALGNTGSTYLGVGWLDRSRTLRLPLPERAVGLAELRALACTVYSARKWDWKRIQADALLEARFVDKGKSEKLWYARGARRGFEARA